MIGFTNCCDWLPFYNEIKLEGMDMNVPSKAYLLYQKSKSLKMNSLYIYKIGSSFMTYKWKQPKIHNFFHTFVSKPNFYSIKHG